MRRLVSFTQVTLDGYFADADGDIAWTHKNDHDAEWNEFVEDNAKGGGLLIFGRVTYEMMASYWPTPQARKDLPVVAEGMNRTPKIVFSRSLKKVAWENTTLLKGGLPGEIRKLKEGSGKEMAILGSGSLVAQLAQEKLIDELRVVVNPEILGRGRSLFSGLEKPQSLKLTKTRSFGNGKVLLTYAPA
jgi:dihydrofolate reductase